MKTVENQKIIIVSKVQADKEHPYTIINLEAIDEAAIRLKNTDFKLWLYIAKNQNNYSFALSRVAFCRWSGVSKPAYIGAVKSLIEKGFLVQKENNSNVYIFYERPNEETDPPTKEDKIIEVSKTKQLEIETTKLSF